MCYPHVDSQQTLPADEIGSRRLIWESLRRDFPLAMTFLTEMSIEVMNKKKKVVNSAEPESPLGQELKEALASDINRSVISEFACHGFAMGFYHCCSPVMAANKDGLNMTATEHLRVYSEHRGVRSCKR